MTCEKCQPGNKNEIGKKTVAKTATGFVRCFRLDCGHAWHIEVPVAQGGSIPSVLPEAAQPKDCDCQDITALQWALILGRKLQAVGNALSAEDFEDWMNENVLPALAPIPSKTLGGETPTKKAQRSLASRTDIAGKVRGVNVLLVGAIHQLSD